MKIFKCDLCGKEIKRISKKWYITIGNGSYDEPDITYDDVCEECKKTIDDVILKIRKGD